MARPRLMATFRPQVWVNDYAMDLEGKVEFDATTAFLSLKNDRIRNFEEHTRDSDELADICDVTDHGCPFEVDVDIDAWLESLGLSDRTKLTDDDIDRLRGMFPACEPQAGRYTKSQDSNAIDDGWTIKDENGYIVAHLDTETMADALLETLEGN